MDSAKFQQNYRIIVEKIFNNWQNLRLAVEHFMGGRNGQQVAIDIMDYTYQFCVHNENITQGELHDVIEELMDQEFDTICEDGSIAEICKHLLRYKQMSVQGQYAEIEAELQKLPQNNEWLRPDVKIPFVAKADESSSEDDKDGSDSDEDIMDVSEPSSSSQIPRSQTRPKDDNFEEPEPGWTTVKNKRK